jgi:hypothetical protein
MPLRTAAKGNSEIQNPKSEESAADGTRNKHRVKSVFNPRFIRGSSFSKFGLIVGGLSLWLVFPVRAQETPRSTDADGWSAPASQVQKKDDGESKKDGNTKAALPESSKGLNVGASSQVAQDQSRQVENMLPRPSLPPGRATQSESILQTSSFNSTYVNPTTGAVTNIPAPPPIVPTNEWTAVEIQQPVKPTDKRTPVDEDHEVKIQLEPPGPDRIFGRRDSEQSLQVRMRQEWRDQKRTPFEFPDEPVLSTQLYTGRVFPPMTETVEPNYLCYGRLYFEDINSERYGWDFGFIQPFVSAGIFFWDTATLPYHMGTEPCRRYECNSGYCLPGDPVPYLIYPPIWSVPGAAAEIAAVVALAAIFPM